MTYIDIFREIIQKEVTEANANKKFIDGLYHSIKVGARQVGNILGLPNVDENTLKDYFDTAKKEYLSVNPIDPGISYSLTKDGLKSWLNEDREINITWNYSERYFKYLLKLGRSSKVVEELKRSSFSILSKIADPKSKDSIYNKGLVVGAVQSGKTENFSAVINRAIDSGYTLIIVLSGIMEDLRRQTQKRIETDVIGTKGERNEGGFDVSGETEVIQVKTLTSQQKDFSKAIKELDPTLNDTYVLVCKKNVSVLKNLIIWLHNSLESNKERHSIPLLLLDDEADNASLNNLGFKGRNDASKTNGHIRAILEMFHVKTYLGYTATPFANVLQDRNGYPEKDWSVKYKFKGDKLEKQLKQVDNIFPDDFIELLSPPSNYVGAKQIFETITPIDNETDDNEKIPLVTPVVTDYIENFPSRVYKGTAVGVEHFRNKNEWDEKNGFGGYLNFDSYNDYRKETRAAKKYDDFPKKLPKSLKIAIKCFILSLAIRESRIPQMVNSKMFQPHNTMLVHISRFTLWQNKTKKLVEEYLKEIISQINNDKPRSPNSIYSEFERIWYSNYGYAHIVEKIKDYLPKGYEDEFMIPIVYDSLKPILNQVIKDIEVKAINSLTKEKLEYPKNTSKKIIAIGGNRLSRGFTLEGLTINYFIRVTNYSDALLQMGRWFGYKLGYLDCCKIFTTQDSLNKFNSTTKCIEELETEFIKMEEKNADPSSFVLRVKKHPGTLKITRSSILKNAVEVRWSYQDQLEMTTRFQVNKEHIEKTWRNFTKNIAPKFKSNRNKLLTFTTDGKEIIDILKNQSNNFDSDRINQMSRFIKLCNDKNLLLNWTVALKISGNSSTFVDVNKFGLDSNLVPKISLAKRKGPSRNSYDDKKSFIQEGIFKASGKNAYIISSNTDLAILLTDTQKKEAIATFRNKKAKELQKKDSSLSYNDALKKAQESTVPERCFREMMSENQGLLIIYLFDSLYAFNQNGENAKDSELKQEFKDYIDKENIDLSIPLVGYAIGFPPIDSQRDPGGVYMKGDYDLSIDENEDEDENEADNEELPNDFNDN